MNRWARRIWYFLNRPRLERELELEMAAHREEMEEPQRFGSMLRLREESADVWGWTSLDDWRREITYAARSLRRAPLFAATAMLTMAIGIGATTGIFTLVHRVVLNPLPYPESDRLVRLEHGIPRINVPSGIGMTPGLFYQYLDRAQTLQDVAIYQVADSTLAGTGEPERIGVAHATPTLASVFRVSPALGRWFSEDEGLPGAPNVAVLSYGLWNRRYGADPGILGRAINLDGETVDVVGVMPVSFAFPDARVQMWVPDRISRAAGFGLPFSRIGVARLRDGATVRDTRAELDRLIADLPNVYPGEAGVVGNVGEDGLRSAAVSLKAATVGNVERTLWILLAAMTVVLLVACANVVNLLMVRSEARQREVAVRRALGATGFGIARFFLTESALLSLAGGMVGVALAWLVVRLVVAFGPTLPRLEEIRFDWVTVVFALGLSLSAAVVCGAAPLRRTGPAAVLRESGRNHTASTTRVRTRQLLMGGQVALALVLLVASGLMVRSVQTLRGVDPGFDATSGLTFRLGLPERGHPTRDAAVTAHQAILEQLSALPGVLAASASSGLPLEDACFGNTVIVRGRVIAVGSTPPVAVLCAVAGDYVETMGLRLRRGRGITRDDVEQRQANVVINQAFADRLFPNQDPIGERIRSNAPPPVTARRDAAGTWMWDGAPPWLTIVGVVSNTPLTALGEANPTPAVYMPMSLAGGPDIPMLAMLGPDVSAMSYVVRSTASPGALLPAVRRAIDAVDPGLAIANARTLQDIVDEGSAQMAFTMVLLAAAAGVGLLLGLIGIYGTIAYVVSQRTGEIGVRLALGARPQGVTGLIVRQSAAVALAGILIGICVALASGELMASLLYGVTPRDPGVFATTTFALLGVALLACWLPARRASRVNPIAALRHE